MCAGADDTAGAKLTRDIPPDAPTIRTTLAAGAYLSYHRPVSLTRRGGFPAEGICDSIAGDVDSRGW